MPYTIRLARPAEREVALQLALDELHRAQRASVIESTMPLARQGVDPMSWLFVATAGRMPVAAAWVQPQVGRTAALWIGCKGRGEFLHLAADTGLSAMRASQAYGWQLLQVLVDPEDTNRITLMEMMGLNELAALRYFEWDTEWRLPAVSGLPLDIAPCAADHPQFAQLLESTYEATLDCPGLADIRNIADTVAGYQSAGDYDSRLWFTVSVDSQLAAVLLLTPYNDLQQWELTYLGVMRPFRRRGIARQLVCHAQHLARDAQVDRIVLAADSSNLPVISIYQQQGFRHWADRIAFYQTRVDGQSKSND
jgi:ribosomal protein S18 acetylase RimI-like enzyme